MGDRISIQFKNGSDKSVVLFSHWDGEDFYNDAKQYVKELKDILANDKKAGGMLQCGPTGRMEPNTIMVDFVRWFTKKLPIVNGNYYFGVDEIDGDNRDNGHKIINLKEE